jgi:malonate-semialdehyde dehydrogenase (acetylating) / methylmalonate-semialdehyde dehydrogenase
VYDPATGAVTAQVPLGDKMLVDQAVTAAQRAGQSWRDSALAQRSRVMFAFRDLVERRSGELADLIIAEHGKVREDALGEVSRGLDVIDFACGIRTCSRANTR